MENDNNNDVAAARSHLPPRKRYKPSTVVDVVIGNNHKNTSNDNNDESATTTTTTTPTIRRTNNVDENKYHSSIRESNGNNDDVYDTTSNMDRNSKRNDTIFDDDDDIHYDDNDNNDTPAHGTNKSSTAIVRSTGRYDMDDEEHPLRTSSLPSPTVALSGHKGSIYSLKYSPNGEVLCSTSFDKNCFLWDHTKQYENFNVLMGHTNAVLDCTWCDNETIVTCSADKTVQLWDIVTGQRLRKWHGQHKNIVNTCSTEPLSSSSSSHKNATTTNVIATGSDDGSCRLWDRRQKQSMAVLQTEYPILAVALTGGSTTIVSEPQVYTAGIDHKITCWNVRTQKRMYSMKGHTDTITSLSVQPNEQTHLLSNGMDQTLKVWDIRPFVGGSNNNHNNKNRLVKTFHGHKHNSDRGLLKCCWSFTSMASSNNNTMVSCGSSDRLVHIWDEYSTEELYMLPGHKGCVNAVTFHPTDTNIVASGGSDNMIYVGELS